MDRQIDEVMTKRLAPIIELARRTPRRGVNSLSPHSENALLLVVTHAARLGYHAWLISDGAGEKFASEEDIQMMNNALVTSMNDVRMAFMVKDEIEPVDEPVAGLSRIFDDLPDTSVPRIIKAMMQAHTEYVDAIASILSHD